MSQATNVSCPVCGTALKATEQLAGGTNVQCPKCRTTFDIPRDAFASLAPPVVAQPAHLADASTATIPASEVEKNRLTPEVGERETATPSRRMLVLGGFGALLALGVGLAFVCFSAFSGGGPNDDDGPPKVVVPKHKGGKKKPVPLIQLTKAEERKVESMTKKAVGFLKKTQRGDGSWQIDGIGHRHNQSRIDFVAMGGLTLLECGEPADGPHVQKAANFVRKAAQKMTSTYGLSLSVLFLGRLYEANKNNKRLKATSDRDLALVKKLALRIVNGQKWQFGGGWLYECDVLTNHDEMKLLEALKSMGKRTVAEMKKSRVNPIRKLPRHLQSLPIFKEWDAMPNAKKIAFFKRGGDNSNTQFAILGLLAAKKLGVPVHQSLRLAAARFRFSQNSDFSWGYSGNNPSRPYPSMTCAGLLGLAVEYGVEESTTKNKSPKSDQTIQRALKFVSNKIGGDRRLPQMYFLWSVERVAVLFKLKEFAGKDWYRWGMDLLQNRQHDDGSWIGDKSTPGGTSKTVDTCFALLFLQRSNLAADLTDKLEELERLNQLATANNRKE